MMPMWPPLHRANTWCFSGRDWGSEIAQTRSSGLANRQPPDGDSARLRIVGRSSDVGPRGASRSAPCPAHAAAGWRLSRPACSASVAFFMRSLHCPTWRTPSPFPAEPLHMRPGAVLTFSQTRAGRTGARGRLVNCPPTYFKFSLNQAIMRTSASLWCSGVWNTWPSFG